MKAQTRCAGIKRDGTQCTNRANPKFNGYCGIHKQQSAVLSAEQKDKRLVDLLTAGASLIAIVEAAHKHIPTALEVITTLCHAACMIEPDVGNPKKEVNDKTVRTAINSSKFRLKGACAYQDIKAIEKEITFISETLRNAVPHLPPNLLSSHQMFETLDMAQKALEDLQFSHGFEISSFDAFYDAIQAQQLQSNR